MVVLTIKREVSSTYEETVFSEANTNTAVIGAHLLASCPAVQGARTRRHTRLLSLLYRELRPIVRQAGLEIEREQPLPFADSQDDERRVADLVVSCHDSRRTTYVDLDIPNPLLVVICRQRPSAVALPRPVCVVRKR